MSGLDEEYPDDVAEKTCWGMFSQAQADRTGRIIEYIRPDGSTCWVTEIIWSVTRPIQNLFPDSGCVGEVVSFVRSTMVTQRHIPIGRYGYSAMNPSWTFEPVDEEPSDSDEEPSDSDEEPSDSDEEPSDKPYFDFMGGESKYRSDEEPSDGDSSDDDSEREVP